MSALILFFGVANMSFRFILILTRVYSIQSRFNHMILRLDILFLIFLVHHTQSRCQSVASLEEWKEDLDYLAEKLQERHANLFHTRNLNDFSQGINELKELAGTISENELLIRISEFIAKIGDAHTYLDFRNQKNWVYKRLPFELEFFEDGLFIVASDSAHQDLIGNRITSINDHPIDSVIAKVRDVGYNENEFTQLISVVRFMIYPAVLKRYGFIDAVDYVDLRFKSHGKSIKRRIEPVSEKECRLVYTHEGRKENLPLTYQKIDEIFWHKYDSADRMLYVQVNKCSEDSIHQFATLSDVIVQTVLEKAPSKLVLDRQALVCILKKVGQSGSLSKFGHI